MRGLGRFGDNTVPTPAAIAAAGARAAAAAAQANQSYVRPFTGRIPVSLDQLNVYNPNRADAIEAIWQPFYDYQTLLAAGATQMQFFQVQQGQAGKTYADTNMQLGGQFPAPTAFLCTAIQVVMFANNNAGAQTGPSTTAAAAAALPNVNDTLKFLNSGYLQVTIGSKTYLTDGPLGKFPTNFSMGGLEALSGTFTAGTFMAVDFARAIGRYYELTPFLIPMTQNFAVTLNWPAAVALTNPARVGVIMDGFYYRQSQ